MKKFIGSLVLFKSLLVVLCLFSLSNTYAQIKIEEEVILTPPPAGIR